VIKKNSYKLNKKNFLIINILLVIGISWLIIAIDFKKIIKTEIEGFQQHFITFSSIIQLFDSGNIQDSKNIKFEDFLPASKQIILVLIDGIFNNQKKDLKEIKLIIKFKHLNKIYEDRESAIALRVNYSPRTVPCKISDGKKIFRCKVNLKGDLEDHWDAKTRFSMRIRVQDGYIYGLKDFAIQKPRARTFPYDQTFAEINSGIGGISNNDQRFYNISFNNTRWGVMNVEPTIDNDFIEVRGLKRFGVFRITNQDSWIYKFQKSVAGANHFISDPTLFFSQRGKEIKILQNKNSREIYSHIFHSINSKNSEIFDREKMIDSFLLALVWGRFHPLSHSNSSYTWNPYTQKLEPILADQASWLKIKNIIGFKKIPYQYGLIFKNKPITNEEYFYSLNKIKKYLQDNDPLKIMNQIRSNYFPNDREIKNSPIKDNIKYLIDNYEDIISFFNKISNEQNLEKKIVDYEFSGNEILNKEFLKIIHFTDGRIQIFNLLSKPIFISKIISGKENININKKILGSKSTFLSKIEIQSEFIGEYDEKIKVEASFEDIKKEFINEFSLISKSQLYEDENNLANKLCKFKTGKNICYISETNKISNDIIFDKKVIIKENSELMLSNGANIIFKSNVEMNGTKDKPILFTGKGSLIILNPDKSNIASKINYVNFDNLTIPTKPLMKFTGSINVHGGKFEISNSKIENGNAEDQLNIVNADVKISKVNFKNAMSDALDCDYCRGKISNVNFHEVHGDALDIAGSDIFLSNINIKSAKDKAVSIGENSNVDIKNLSIEDSGTGVAVKDGSEVSIDKVSIKRLSYDSFMTYVKKPFFTNYTQLNVKNIIGINDLGGSVCVRDENTFAKLENKICEKSIVDVEYLYQKGRMKK
jgi:hypothetical protein